MPTAARRATMAEHRTLTGGRQVSTHPDIQHGTATGYNNHLCRCEPCTTAWTTTKIADDAARRARTAAEGVPRGVKHGASCYKNWGCRCDKCRRAARQADRRRDRRGRYGKTGLKPCEIQRTSNNRRFGSR